MWKNCKIDPEEKCGTRGGGVYGRIIITIFGHLSWLKKDEDEGWVLKDFVDGNFESKFYTFLMT
jgi:hypothetical protein